MKSLLCPPATLLFFILVSCCLSHLISSSSSATVDVEEQINHLKQAAYSNPEGSPLSTTAWLQVLALDPRNLEAHVMLGSAYMSAPSPHIKERGVQLLEDAFDPSKVTPTIDFRFPQTYILAATIGRYRNQCSEYSKAKKFTKLALELSKARHATANNNEDGDVCIQMQLATMFDYFPASTDAADEAIHSMMGYATRLLAQPGWNIDDSIVSTMPGAAADPYNQCILSMFSLSFYYRADVAKVARMSYEMARRGWPALDTTADFVRRYDEEDVHPCIKRKIRLLVISAVMTEGHSNSESFGGVFSRLDRDIFDVTYVLLAGEKGSTANDIAQFTKTHAADRIRVFSKERGDTNNGAWTARIASEIESWEMDILFHFELTMSPVARRLAMRRLAPVQINSIGHPITSGHDRSVVQYYVSWEASELPMEVAQKHYTEELVLMPADSFFMYYERRVLPGQVSRMDGQAFGHLTRADFGLPLGNENVYLCMQKPFKFHPEVDELICGIMAKDRNGLVVLHREKSAANQEVFENRLKKNGCDLSRIRFFESQPHHRLLALYRESTVVLDSYPAGGDTTTREVLEMGKPLVTLPGRLLGGRWSLGYMSSIGLTEDTKRALIATTPNEYIDLAIKLGSDDVLRESVEADIRKSVKNLFQRDDAVAAWQNMFLELSPYQQCSKEKLGREGDSRDEL